MRIAILAGCFLFAAFIVNASAARAASVDQSTVSVGGVSAALLKPAHPKGGIILLAGGAGNIGVGPNGTIAREGNQLVRTRAAYAARGFAVLVPDCCVDVAAAVQYMHSFGDTDNVMNMLGSPSALPSTLIVHHRQDGCFKTLPAGVAPFLEWAKGKARVTWLDGGRSEGNPCEAWAHHGFNGQDGQVVSAVAGFAAR